MCNIQHFHGIFRVFQQTNSIHEKLCKKPWGMFRKRIGNEKYKYKLIIFWYNKLMCMLVGTALDILWMFSDCDFKFEYVDEFSTAILSFAGKWFDAVHNQLKSYK